MCFLLSVFDGIKYRNRLTGTNVLVTYLYLIYKKVFISVSVLLWFFYYNKSGIEQTNYLVNTRIGLIWVTYKH